MELSKALEIAVATIQMEIQSEHDNPTEISEDRIAVLNEAVQKLRSIKYTN